MPRRGRFLLVSVLPLAGALLAACATPSLSELQSQSVELRQQRSVIQPGDALAAELAQPLDAARAVRIALLNNPGARATLAQLQIAQGDLYEALRMPNPSIDVALLDGAGGVSRTSWSISQPLLDLLFTGYRRKHGELAMREAQQLAADQLLRLERDVRQAWLHHTAANLRLRIAQRAAEAAGLASELAEGYYKAGNISEAQWRAERALAAEALLAQGRREVEQLAARTALLDLLGLGPGQAQLQLDDRLALPPPFQPSPEALTTQALQQRLDLGAQAAALEIAQRASEHTRRWRWLPFTALHVEGERQTGEGSLVGPGVSLQLPFPDTGAGRVARAAGRVEVRAAELAASQLAVRNRIALNCAVLAIASRSIEEHARNLLEQNERLLALAGEQHNFMLIGSFELLGVRRRQIEGHDQWIDAIEGWWRAFNDLSYESGVALPRLSATSYVSAEDLP